MKKTLTISVALCLALFLLPVWCLAGTMDTFVPDSPSSSAEQDAPDLSDAAGTVSELLDSIKTDPGVLDNYQALARLYASQNLGGYKVFVDGSLIDFSNYDNVQPTAQSGRTLVPVRAITEALGAILDWDSASQTVTITLNGTVVKLMMGSSTAFINNDAVTLDVPASAVGGRTMVPLRFVGNAFGEQVGWFPSGNMNVIAIFSPTE